MKNKEKLSSTVPLHEIESGALNQLETILALDECVKLAVMPDIHQGYFMPIGTVAEFKGVICPAAVGADISCGMIHVNTNLKADEFFRSERDKQLIYDKIWSVIPTGFNKREFPMECEEFVSGLNNKNLENEINSIAGFQVGTLGGGNHFLELGVNKENYLGITIHSGSRRSGKTLFDYYTKNFPLLLDINSHEGKAYYSDMLWAQNYAFLNREIMKEEILKVLGFSQIEIDYYKQITINETHNHAVILENGNVLHRKGATPADKDEYGVIPANQRDGVFITRGLGNKEFLCSASHGCGRKMSRNKAKENIDLNTFKEQMNGIICKTQESGLDEAPDAYKDCNYVIEHQNGILVDVIDHVKPIIVVKG